MANNLDELPKTLSHEPINNYVAFMADLVSYFDVFERYHHKFLQKFDFPLVSMVVKVIFLTFGQIVPRNIGK